MKWFRNLRVGVRLGVASGVLAGLLLLLMVMAYRGETQLSNATHEVRQAGVAQKDVGDLRVATGDLDAEQTSYSLDVMRGAPQATSDNVGTRGEFLEAEAGFHTVLDQVAKDFTSGEGKSDVANLRKWMTEFEGMDNQIINLYRKGTPEDITQGVNIATGRSADMVDQMAGTAEHLATLADAGSKRADAASAQARTFSTELIVMVGLVALALGALLMWIITRSISRPLRKAVSALNRVADGDLTVRLDLDS